MNRLGHRAYDPPDLRVIGYEWDARELGWVAIGLFPNTGLLKTFRLITHRVLWLAFDEQGKLGRYGVTKEGNGIKPRKQVASRNASQPSPPAPAAAKS
jgi:hypothetical protein